jgi:hypothetical protein
MAMRHPRPSSEHHIASGALIVSRRRRCDSEKRPRPSSTNRHIKLTPRAELIRGDRRYYPRSALSLAPKQERRR